MPEHSRKRKAPEDHDDVELCRNLDNWPMTGKRGRRFKNLISALRNCSADSEKSGIDSEEKSKLKRNLFYIWVELLQVMWQEMIGVRRREIHAKSLNKVNGNKMHNIILKLFRLVCDVFSKDRKDEIGTFEVDDVVKRICDEFKDEQETALFHIAVVVQALETAIPQVVCSNQYGAKRRMAISSKLQEIMPTEDYEHLMNSIYICDKQAMTFRSELEKVPDLHPERQKLFYSEMALMIKLFELLQKIVDTSGSEKEVRNDGDIVEKCIEEMIFALAEQLVPDLSFEDAGKCLEYIGKRVNQVEDGQRYQVAVMCEFYRAILNPKPRQPKKSRKEGAKKD